MPPPKKGKQGVVIQLLNITKDSINDKVDDKIISLIRPVEFLKNVTIVNLQNKPPASLNTNITLIKNLTKPATDAIDNIRETFVLSLINNPPVLTQVGDKVETVNNLVDNTTTNLKDFIDNQLVAVSNLNNNLANRTGNRTSAIRDFIDNQLSTVGNLSNNIFNTLNNRTRRIFNRINQRLQTIEKKLAAKNPQTANRQYDGDDDNFGDDDGNDNDSGENGDWDWDLFKSVNERLETIEKNLEARQEIDEDSDMGRSLIDSDDEKVEGKIIRNPLPNAIKNAQDRFNKVIEDQVTRVSDRINQINDQVDQVFGRLQAAVANIKPTTVAQTTTTKVPSIINWTPKSTTRQPPLLNAFTEQTPSYFKYTVPDNSYRKEETDQMDVNDLQAEIVESVKDTMKLEGNSDDKLKAEAAVVDVESALAEELRNELQEEKSQIDADDMARIVLEYEEEEGDDDEQEQEEEASLDGEELPKELINSIDIVNEENSDPIKVNDELKVSEIPDIPMNDEEGKTD